MSKYTDALASIVSKTAKLRLATHMLGLQSISRGLNWEHDNVERDSATCNAALNGDQASSEGNGMGDMILADRVEYGSHYGQKPQASPLATALLAALAGIGGTLAYQNMQDEPPPPVVEEADPSLTVQVKNPDDSQ